MKALVTQHERMGKTATITMAKPTGRNQLLPIDGEGVLCYNQSEDLNNDTAWVNADCFVFQRKIFDYLVGNYDLEKQLFVSLSERQQLATYQHKGYFAMIETKRDLATAENLWNAGMAPWI